MAYQGNTELSFQAQERVMTAFRQAVGKLQDGQREEAMIGLEFVLRLDPAFTPAVNLRRQLSSGAHEIDLGDIIGQLDAPSTEAVNEILVTAVDAFNSRDFVQAREHVERVLIELPGHREARQLLGQIDDALKVEGQVGQFLAQAREALDQGDPQEAANFVMMAQALDPHHAGIASALQDIYDRGGVSQDGDALSHEAFAFETSDAADDGFAVQFDGEDQAVPTPAEPEFSLPTVDDKESEAWSEPEFPVAWDEPGEAVAPPGVATAAVDGGGDLFSEPSASAAMPRADDISDLFEEQGAVAEQGGDEAAVGEPDDERQQVQLLLKQGDAAFEAGDYLAAIDRWSRVFLFETADQGVSDRIEQARQAVEERDRRVDHLLFEAEDAMVGGEGGRALELLTEILALAPDNPRALEMTSRLETGGVAAPAGDVKLQEMPDLDEDLFEERVVAPAAIEEPREPLMPLEETIERRLLGLPVRTAAMIGGGVLIVVVAVAGLLLSGVLGGPGETQGDIYDLRVRTEELFKDGNAAEALRLIEAYEVKEPAEQVVMDRLLTRYREALASPTPTPIPANLVRARELYANGLWFHAYSEVMTGLKQRASDAALLEMKRTIENTVPMVSRLHAALTSGNYQSAVGLAKDLLATHPDQPDLRETLERSLFNAALSEMRTYNLTGAEGYLRELDQLDPNDEVVERILEFIDKYKARPVDMTLQVFIGSLDDRPRRDVMVTPSPPPATPTAVPGTMAAETP